MRGSQCGRGVRAVLGAGLVAVLLCGGWLPGAVAQEGEKLPPAEQVIERSIEALGGRAAFEKLDNRVVKGTFEIIQIGLKGPMHVYSAPEYKEYTQIELPGFGTMQSGSNGEVYWKIDPMAGPQVLEGTDKALQKREARFNSVLYWKNLYEKVECVGVEEAEGKQCYKVVFTPEEGEPEVTFYDRNRYIPVKMEFKLNSAQGPVVVEVIQSDYRQVDGVMIPHSQKQVIADGMQTIVIKIESIEHNKDIPAERFELPEPVKQLLDKKKSEKKSEGQGN